ncbi:TonB-dependent receptor [Marinilabilia salmonicolor]|uniref:TonB-dependent receptor n=1 Tax=Marinilabilia salmonicolor TaxID=989 RepID=UPI00138963D2|nr:TonB-dependent receptor [Marinilabilia salmonicolor]
MKRIMKCLWFGLFLLFLLDISLNAQKLVKINGAVTAKNGGPVEFATVVFKSLPDSGMVTGVITGSDGGFSVNVPGSQEGLIQVSCVGYELSSQKIALAGREFYDMGELTLIPASYALEEVRAVRDRIRAKNTSGGTTYFVNRNMKEASASGIDMVKFVPGIQVDMMQNVMVEGRNNVVILVDGIERSVDFLGQLDSDRIDKIEINHQPGTQYRSDVSAVVNVVTRKNEVRGFSGHLNGEIPARSNEIYSFPSASVLYSAPNLNVFSSYRGEFSYFDIESENTKKIFEGPELVLKNRELLSQKNWSHKVMAGVDWFPDSKNQFNIYAFVNPYSNEQDGFVTATRDTENETRFEKSLEKDELDDNLAFGGSLYFKHLFDGAENQSVAFEAGYYQFDGRKGTKYMEDEVFWTSTDAYERALMGKMEYQVGLNSRWRWMAGGEGHFRKLGDAVDESEDYQENILSGFTSIVVQGSGFEGQAGVRAEFFQNKVGGEELDGVWSFFPFVSFSFKPSAKHQVKLSYRRSVVRPHLIQLMPSLLSSDFFTQKQGNPYLHPEFFEELALEYSLLVGNQFLSVGPFFSRSTDVIADFTTMKNPEGFFKQPQNLGDITRLGVRFNAALKPFDRLIFSSYFRFFRLETAPKGVALMHQIESVKKWTSEWGFGLSWQMNHGWSLSASGMQRADVHQIQSSFYEDFLYFVSLDKKIFRNLTVGVTSAVPFAGKVTYQGYSLMGDGFSENVDDNILTSECPFWFKIKYTFSSGKSRGKIRDSDVFEDKRMRDGF